MVAAPARPRARPSSLALAGWFVLGAAVALMLMVFQPLLGFGLAGGLPLAALGLAFGDRSRPASPRAYSLGAFGLGMLMLNVVLLVPVVARA